MHIGDGKGRGYNAEVNELNQLLVRAIGETRPSYISRSLGETYTATAIDAGPVAAEYTIYLQNNSETPIVINSIKTSNVDADVIWKLHQVTGTAAGTAITPVNLNLTSGNDANVTCIGGAGGVTGLTSSAVITTWYGGNVYSTRLVEMWLDALILGKNDAIAMEYDAGTGGACAISIMFHSQF